MIKLFEEFVNDKEKVIKLGDSNENVKKIQKDLTVLGFDLDQYGIDGKFGKETLGQIKNLFSTLKQIPKYRSEYININTEITPEITNKISELAKSDAVEYIRKFFDKKYKNIDLIGKEIISKNIESPEEFAKKLKKISKELRINPNWLVAVMFKESNIDHKAENKNGGATGLIQFMPATAKGLGTTVDKLKNMTAIEQLDYVYKYFKPYKGKINSYTDLYSITFYPYMINKESDYVVGSERSDKYAELVASHNKAIDINQDKKISYDEFKQYSYKRLPADWIRNLNA